jgi:hypothetical protein
MKIELYPLKCNHPLGPHIHILMPHEPEILNALFQGFGIRDSIDQDLVQLEKLATPSTAAIKCTVYKLDIDCESWAVVALRAYADSNHAIRALFVRIDPECQIPGPKVAEMIRVQLAKATMEYGDAQ